MNLGNYFLLLIIGGILLTGIIKQAPVFDLFLKGAREGVLVTIKLLPALVGLLTSVAMLKASGVLDVLTYGLKPISRVLLIPAQVIPLALIRPISGSGALAVLDNILATHGPDTFIGQVASVIQGTTETTFYVITMYFGAVEIKKTRHALPAALSADITAFIVAGLAVKLFLGG